MMAQAQDTITTTRPARRADAGAIRLSQRDIDGLLLCGERYGCPYDLLAAAVRVPAVRLRRAGCADTGRLGPGPGWCWLTRAGMTGTGLGFPAVRPALGRLAHVRAVLAARLWLQANPAWSQGQPIRNAIAWFNRAHPQAAVLLTQDSDIAGLGGDVYENHWHQYNTLDQIRRAGGVQGIRRLLDRWKVRYLIARKPTATQYARPLALRDLLDQCTIAEYAFDEFFVARLEPVCRAAATLPVE